MNFKELNESFEKRYLTEKKQLNTYEVIFLKYERYSGGKISKARFTDDNDIDALLQVESVNGYGTLEDEDPDTLTLDEVKNQILSRNGDGCDYVCEVKNITTNEVIFSDDIYKEYDESLERKTLKEDVSKSEYSKILNIALKDIYALGKRFVHLNQNFGKALKYHMSDEEDFIEVSVRELEQALIDCYNLGKDSKE